MAVQTTPLMDQYHRIKREHEDHILFFRMGDFYEMFGEDAKVASRVLGIALTTRDKGKDHPIPLAGIPWHAAESYIARMIEAGHSVAICEQVEDAKAARGLVKREVVRVITPGTVLSPDVLETGTNRFLAALARRDDCYGMAYLDVSTGEFFVREGARDDVIGELSAIRPSEILTPAGWREDGSLAEIKEAFPESVIAEREDFRFAREVGHNVLTSHFRTQSLEAFGCELMDAGIGAAGSILEYVRETQGRIPEHIDRVVSVAEHGYMVIDGNAQRLLELLPAGRQSADATDLFRVLNRTATAMGSRMLKNWIRKPLVDLKSIRARQKKVEALFSHHQMRDEIRRQLREISDIERLVGRVVCERVNARDLVNLKNSLSAARRLRAEILPAAGSPLSALLERVSETPAVVAELDRALVPDPPATLREGGFIKDGYHTELDELRNIRKEGKGWIAALQKRERSRTRISSLKVGYNRIFGYYLEVTRPHLKSVPPDYVRRQTLVNAERFVTPELKEKESKILGAESRIVDLEYDLFRQIREKIVAHRQELQETARALAELDVYQSLATTAVENGYSKPEINRSTRIEIVEGRHPTVEHFLPHQAFVPNDALMDSRGRQILIITGPNMAGKSTYLRQVALIVILAQMGSFVPAAQASIGIVDRIFTRIGASESLARGKSTFLVEMTEVAHILHHATSRSLILLDEVGRGTSTYDGISIAWAVAEHLHGAGKEGPKTLFATHYHELTELAGQFPRMHNLNVAVREWNDEIVLLRKVVEGGADRSYGIHAARVAGLPPEVLARARGILNDLESGRSNLAHAVPGADPGTEQIDLFAPQIPPRIQALTSRIESMDPDALTPLEALTQLHELKQMVEGDDRENSGSS